MKELCVSPCSITSIIFVSTAKPGLGQEDFLAIKTVVQRNSERFGITGLLACNGFNFIQCIEGDPAAVEDLLYRIERDDRHSGMIVLSHGKAETRQFAQLHMVGRYWSLPQNSTQDELSTILAENSVSGVARMLFHSFNTLGVKNVGQ